MYKEKSPFVSVTPFLYQEEMDDSKSLKILVNEEDNDLNLHNNLPPYLLHFS